MTALTPANESYSACLPTEPVLRQHRERDVQHHSDQELLHRPLTPMRRSAQLQRRGLFGRRQVPTSAVGRLRSCWRNAGPRAARLTDLCKVSVDICT